MAGRLVEEGLLGCPVCQREYPVRAGVVEFGDAAPPAGGAGAPAPDAAGLVALLGLEGPGGYLALIGDVAREAEAVGALLPGVHLALVNPPAGTRSSPGGSVLRGPVLPLKARSLRGAVLGAPWAGVPAWTEAALGAVLPGLRAVGEGEPPAGPGVELLGAAGGWWVARRSG